MPGEMGLLTFLGESADWLKGPGGVSICDHRVAALAAFRAAWSKPADEEAHEGLRSKLTRLLDALRHNHLYPDAVLLGSAEDGSVQFLPSPADLRKDFERLRDFCVVNKFGIGEVHLLYVVFLLCRSHYQPEPVAYDQVLEEAVGDVLLLRVPIYRADNLAPFSSELGAHFLAVRLLRCMKKLGLFDDAPVGKPSPKDQAEMSELVADPLCPVAGKYIQKPHRVAFDVLDTASALEAYARAHAASRAPLDPRSPDELAARLRRRIRKLDSYSDIGPARLERLQTLGAAAMMRAVAHVDSVLGQNMYSFLRSKRHKPFVRHSRMFQFLPNNAERLRFLNFLYTHGKQNPVYYVNKFQPHFPGEKLRFVRNEVGFTLEPSSEAE